MNKIFEVRSLDHAGKLHHWGAYKTRAEATQRVRDRFEGRSEEWAKKHHKKWWIEEIDTAGLFEIPSLPMPRDQFSLRTTEIDNGEGVLGSLDVEILGPSGEPIAAYKRNLPGMARTFEPFRQEGRLFALISSDYTATSVLDLESGEMVASETPDEFGFCPAGFYVPDWWDLHDGSILPGSSGWKDCYEKPDGQFGFVWGCVWGDDWRWKVQFLDLTDIQRGIIRRDDRFGYLPLESVPDGHPKQFIQCAHNGDDFLVSFRTFRDFELGTGGERFPKAFV